MGDHQVSDKGNAPALGTDLALLQQMVSILLEEKMEALSEKKEKQRIYAARDKSRKELSSYNVAQKQQAQKLCSHLKGGKIDEHHPKGPLVDYAVYHHTYPDGSTAIKCLICSMSWKKKDTADYLVRGGKRIPNHTGLGWLDALRMIRQSTNTPTSSEINVTARITNPHVDPDLVEETV
jgi:hypothetical protein